MQVRIDQRQHHGMFKTIGLMSAKSVRLWNREPVHHTWRDGSDGKGISPAIELRETVDLLGRIEYQLSRSCDGAFGRVWFGDYQTVGVKGDENIGSWANYQLSRVRGETKFALSSAIHNLRNEEMWTTPPATLLQLRDDASRSIYQAYGVPVEVATAVANREVWRQFVSMSVRPMADHWQAEIQTKLNTPELDLDFSRLTSTDLSARSRSFKQLVEAGASIDQAASVCDLSIEQEPSFSAVTVPLPR